MQRQRLREARGEALRAPAGPAAVPAYVSSPAPTTRPTHLLTKPPLQHYAVLFDATDAAKLLMRRAAGAAGGGELQRCRDARGRTPMDLAMAKGRVADEELFLLLSS